MSVDPTRAARRAHAVTTALLALAVVPDPAARLRRGATFAELVTHQQRADAVMRRVGPALSVASAGTGLLAAASARRDGGEALLRVGSALAVAAAVVLTVRVHVPVNEQLRTWTPDDEVPGWRATWDRWERAHVVRRALTAAAGGLAAAAAVRAR